LLRIYTIYITIMLTLRDSHADTNCSVMLDTTVSGIEQYYNNIECIHESVFVYT